MGIAEKSLIIINLFTLIVSVCAFCDLFMCSFQHKPKVRNINHVGDNIRRAPSPLRPRPPSVIAAEQLAAKKEQAEKRYKRGKVPK